MEINGTQIIPAPRPQVWSALNDPAILKLCVPGCESVEQATPGNFQIVVAMAIGPLRARFKGALRMTEAKPPSACKLVFEGQGGAVGFGKGSTTVELKESPGGTELTYAAEAQVGGKLAQVGSRLIDSFAKKMSDDFFNALRKQLAPGEAQAASPTSLRAVPAAVKGSDRVPQAEESKAVGPSAVPMPFAGTPVDTSAGNDGNRPILVPGWWLGVAMLLGVFATYIGAHWMR